MKVFSGISRATNIGTFGRVWWDGGRHPFPIRRVNIYNIIVFGNFPPFTHFPRDVSICIPISVCYRTCTLQTYIYNVHTSSHPQHTFGRIVKEFIHEQLCVCHPFYELHSIAIPSWKAPQTTTGAKFGKYFISSYFPNISPNYRY